MSRQPFIENKMEEQFGTQSAENDARRTPVIDDLDSTHSIPPLSCRFFVKFMTPVYFRRGLVSERLVRPFMVVIPEIGSKTGNQIFYGLVVLEINIFILHRPPQALHHDVVHGPPLAVHADLYLVLLQHPGEGRSRVLEALVRVENLRVRMLPEGPLQGADAKSIVHGHRNFPGQYVPTVPIHHRRQKCKTPLQPDIRDIASPDLTWPMDIQTAEKVRVYLMAGGRHDGTFAGGNGNQAHQPHQPLYSLPIDLVWISRSPLHTHSALL